MNKDALPPVDSKTQRRKFAEALMKVVNEFESELTGLEIMAGVTFFSCSIASSTYGKDNVPDSYKAQAEFIAAALLFDQLCDETNTNTGESDE